MNVHSQSIISNHVAKMDGAPLNLRQILVPVDFSEPSKAALLYALRFAKRFGAKLTVIHVAQPIPHHHPLSMTPESMLHNAEACLAGFCAGMGCGPGAIETRVIRQGNAFHEICDAAHAYKCDLVIIGTYGRGGLRHMLLGSTAERVVRQSCCPVLVVHQQADEAESTGTSGADASIALPPLQFRKLLVPMDFSDCAKKALRCAGALAGKFGAQITLLHTVQLAPVIGEAPLMDIESIECQMRENAQRDLEVLRKTVDVNVPSEILVRAGSPPEEIIKVARERDIDLIVISTYGHAGVAHVLLGSTAEKVVRHASCPVLVLRQCQHEFVG